MTGFVLILNILVGAVVGYVDVWRRSRAGLMLLGALPVLALGVSAYRLAAGEEALGTAMLAMLLVGACVLLLVGYGVARMVFWLRSRRVGSTT